MAEALALVAPLMGANRPTASVVHDLAIRGAAALMHDHTLRDDAVQHLVDTWTSDDRPFDTDVLANIDQLVWKQE